MKRPITDSLVTADDLGELDAYGSSLTNPKTFPFKWATVKQRRAYRRRIAANLLRSSRNTSEPAGLSSAWGDSHRRSK